MTDDDAPKLGSCCACGGRDDVRNILTLQQKSPIPGRGWGCFTCELPLDGATAVVCDRCLEENQPLQFACRGYPAEDGRIPISILQGEHKHNFPHE